MTARFTERLASYCLLAALVAFFSIHYYGYIGSSGISPGDEYLTLDRTNAFSVMGDYSTVYTGNLPSFAKPPLQYWLGSLLLMAHDDIFYAIKLPSFVFSILTLLAAFFLTRCILPERPIAAVFPPLILAVSDNFWRYANSAMLDSGAAFFALAAVAALFVALDRPRFWYLWALVVFLGALQKAPIGLAFSVIVLVYLAFTNGSNMRELLAKGGQPHLRNAALLALALMAIWPAWQAQQYGLSAIRYGVGEQMLERFSPISNKLFNDFSWVDWIIGANGRLFWIAGSLLALFHLFRSRQAAIASLSAIAIVFILAMLAARGKIYDRYVLILYPVLAVIVVYSVFKFVRNGYLAGSAMLAMFLFNGHFLYGAQEISATSSREPPFASQLATLKQLATPDKTIILCRAVLPEEPSLSAVSYYSSNRAPVLVISNQADPAKHRANLARSHDFIGLCRAKYADMLEAVFADFKVLETGDGFLIWSADSVR